MTHAVIKEDSNGDLVDVKYYCSDYCAKGDPDYAGWNGAHELSIAERCNGCGRALYLVKEEA